MNFVDRVKGKSQKLRKKQLSNNKPQIFNIGGTINSGRANVPLSDAMVGWSYACINMLSKEIQVSTFKLLDSSNPDDLKSLPPEHWLPTLFRNPNKQQTWTIMSKLVSQWMYASGDGYIWTPISIRGVSIGRPMQMWALPSNRIKIVSSQEKLIDHYILNSGAGQTRIPENEMIHISLPQPSAILAENIIEGVPGELNAAADAINVDRERLGFAKAFFKREGLTPWIITWDDKMENDQWQEMKERIRASLPSEFWPKILLDEGRKAQSLEANSNAATGQLNNLAEQLISEISSMFGVPLEILLGKFSGDRSGTSIKTQTSFFRSNSIRPKLKIIEEVITKHFTQFDTNVVFQYDAEEFFDPVEQRKQEQHDISYAIRTIDEIRVRDRGFESNSELDVPMIVSSLVVFDKTSESQENNTGESRIIEETNQNTIKQLSEADKYTYWKSYDSEAEKTQDLLEPIIIDVFERLNKDINRNINAALIKSLTKSTPQKKLDDTLRELDTRTLTGHVKQEMIDKAVTEYTKQMDVAEYKVKQEIDLFDIEKWKAIIEKETDPEIKKFLIKMFKLALGDIGVGFDDIETEYQKELRRALERTLEKISDPISTIDKELREKIKNIIRDNPLATEKELAKLFREAVDSQFKTVYTESRTRMIARTTTTFGIGESQSTLWKEQGFKFTWLTQRDGKVRISHRKADGKKPNDEGEFTVGTDKMKHPGSGSQAKENVNCRCVLRPEPK